MDLSVNQSASTTKFIAFLVFAFTFGALMMVQAVLRPDAIAGVYFHGIPSESMMQTVSILDLRDQPLVSLWNIHIQPPLFDAIRAVLASISGATDTLQLQYEVDGAIYLIWAMAYGSICTVVFLWLSRLTNLLCGLVGALFFAASPAALLYATLLETTLLSSLFILLLIFLLWRISRGEFVSPWVLSLIFLTLFFTRSVFQWPWVVLLGVCLWLMNYPRDAINKFLLVSSLVIFLYLTKQFVLFGVSTTSSFSGLNLCQSIGACKPHHISEKIDGGEGVLPKVLTRERKLTGAHNFNHQVDLQLNKAYLQDFKDGVISKDLVELLGIYQKNALIYFQPSSSYAGTNQLLVILPERWRIYYEKIFSAPIFLALLVFSLMFWLKEHNLKQWKSSLGVGLPVLAIFAISILFESGENMRFKFFIEPVLYIFIVSQLCIAGKYSWNYLVSVLAAIIGKANSS